jgi:FkbM family methyltransferase
MDGVHVKNFVVIDSIHGKFIVNRHCAHQAEALIKTGATHIERELGVIRQLAGLLPDGAVAVDAGANIGFVCVPLAGWLKPRGGRVVAFEPQRMLFYALCGTAALNDLDNLQVRNLGVGSRPGTLRVPPQDYGKPKDFGMVSLKDQDAAAAGETVEIVRIDDLALPRLDFLKIDVEGMEIDVLEGAAGSLARHRPICWVEYWLTREDLLRGVFAGQGYRMYRMDKLNVLCVPEETLARKRLSIAAPPY